MRAIDIHNARVAFAERVAKDSLESILSVHLYEQWDESLQKKVHDYILDKIQVFIRSGDVKDVEVEQRFVQPNDKTLDMKIEYELRVIPQDHIVVDYTTSISGFDEALEESK